MHSFRLPLSTMQPLLALRAAAGGIAPMSASAQEKQIDCAALRDETVRAMSAYLQINTTNLPGNELATAKWLQPSCRRRESRARCSRPWSSDRDARTSTRDSGGDG